ncbi:unnamed protein product [Peronospora belbahrii]|uniref:Uncharacterized protein n=1 Tax=Peronospora belbahrii TaxID=622444 RepID=A0ABN8CST9_9STRA|nr:unnamed protein product [Peronospora belbahrii]
MPAARPALLRSNTPDLFLFANAMEAARKYSTLIFVSVSKSRAFVERFWWTISAIFVTSKEEHKFGLHYNLLYASYYCRTESSILSLIIHVYDNKLRSAC